MFTTLYKLYRSDCMPSTVSCVRAYLEANYDPNWDTDRIFPMVVIAIAASVDEYKEMLSQKRLHTINAKLGITRDFVATLHTAKDIKSKQSAQSVIDVINACLIQNGKKPLLPAMIKQYKAPIQPSAVDIANKLNGVDFIIDTMSKMSLPELRLVLKPILNLPGVSKKSCNFDIQSLSRDIKDADREIFVLIL